jgi:hypothetical protein
MRFWSFAKCRRRRPDVRFSAKRSDVERWKKSHELMVAGVERNLSWITDGVYQSAFLTT